MPGHHDPFLVALSILIAIAASYAALDFASRVAASSGRTQSAWLLAGSCAMGIGIWSMHFLGMLAFDLPVPIAYDAPLVAISAGVAVVASAFALWVAARPAMGRTALIGGGTLMGLAIAAMHYIGMAALRADVLVTYRPAIVAVSVVIAMTAASASLLLAHRYRTVESTRMEWGKLGSAVVMGLAIAGMHYSGMAAAHFTVAPGAMRSSTHLMLAGSALVASVALGTLCILAVALVGALLHRYSNERLLEATRASSAALQEQRAFLRQVIDAMPNYIFVKNGAGQFTLVNTAMASLFGTTPDALVGRTDAEIVDRPEELARFLRDDREVMQKRLPKLITEEPVPGPDGQPQRWYQTMKVPLSAAGGREIHVLGISTDVTVQKQLAEELRQAQKMEAIGQLTGGIAHDLNNIFTVILANTDLMAAQVSSAQTELRRDMQDLQAAAGRGADMVRKLLAFSRREMIKLRPARLERLSADLLQTLQRLLPATIQITFRADRDLPGIVADSGAVEQMVMNLVTNARDAMPDGGALILSVSQIQLDDEWCAMHGWGTAGRFVCLSVSDTGVGMTAATRERIFEPFFTTKPQGAGTGLGLPMVYGLMRQHDGYVDLYSEPGQGTTVKLFFPARDEPVTAGTPQSSRIIRGGSETVLIADDEEPIRRSVARVLERHGYTVRAARDGLEALELLQRPDAHIDLVISDVVMPRMGGRELYQQLRANGRQVPFLITSGYAAREVWESVAMESDVPFLHKPWAMTDLLQKVRAVLDDA